MASNFEPPRFDEAAMFVGSKGSQIDMIMHRNVTGEVFAFHSPLANSPVSCTICAGGARVYLSDGRDSV